MQICIYGSAVEAIHPSYLIKSEMLGEELARRGHTLVFGGGACGVMGAVARGAKRAGGKIIGIATAFFDVDGALFEECDQLLKPETMRERKKMLEDYSQAFIIMPGGIGTLDEFFETIVLKSLSFQPKPIAIYNINGYYNRMKDMLDFAVEEHFVAKEAGESYEMFDSAKELLDYIEGK